MSDDNQNGEKPVLKMEGKAPKEAQPEHKPINETDDFGPEYDETPEQQTGGEGTLVERKKAEIRSDVNIPKNAGLRNVIIICFAAVGLIAILALLSMCVNTVRVAVPTPKPQAAVEGPKAEFNVDYSGDKDTRPGSAPGGSNGEPGASATRTQSPQQ